LGLIGGGPTVLGTVLGHQFSSDAVSILFLTLAGGSILYVVIQLVGIALALATSDRLYWGVLVGLASPGSPPTWWSPRPGPEFKRVVLAAEPAR